MGFPEKRDVELQRQAEEAVLLADDLIDWVGRFGNQRRDVDVGSVSQQQEFELLRLRREAESLFGSSKVPAAAAVYGASQSGKSLFVSRVLEPSDSRFSPLGLDDKGEGYIKELSFNFDMNPQCGANEATALVTRFSVKNRLKTFEPPSKYPVTVRALTRSEWLRVLGRGVFSECEIPKFAWDEENLEALFGEASTRHGVDKIDRQWRLDLFECYSYMRRLDPLRFTVEESLFNSLLGKYPLSDDGYLEVAGKLLWFSDLFPELTPWFKEVNNFLQLLANESQNNSMAIHWAAVRFLLDSQLKTEQHSKDSTWRECVDLRHIVEKQIVFGDKKWTVLDYDETSTRGLSRERLAVIQSALLEMTVPVLPERLNDDWRAVIEDIDILDIPGARAEGKNTSVVDTLDKKLNIVKRGKVDYLFDRYIEERQVQTVFLVVRYGNLEVRDKLKLYLDKWGRIRYGEDIWPRKVHEAKPALFIGLTGIDEEMGGRTIIREFYDKRLSVLTSETLFEIMTDFGGQGKRFRNCYPIRYPGTWDKSRAQQEKFENPRQWEQAKKAFLESPLVQEHVEDPAGRWDVAMQDNDGGLSLISQGFRDVTSALQKQDALKQHLDRVHAALNQLWQRWYVDPNANQRRELRLETARRVLDWLTADEEKIYVRVQALESALCLDEGDVAQLADPTEQRANKSRLRPESVEQRLPRELKALLEEWAANLAPERWKGCTATSAEGAPWLGAEDFSSLTAYLQDYLCTAAVFEGLAERLKAIVNLRGDQAIRRHARREFVRLILNDFVMNPGPGIGPMGTSQEARSVSEGQNGHDFGLMEPFVTQWRSRLPEALALGAGEHTNIPAGNAELLELLNNR